MTTDATPESIPATPVSNRFTRGRGHVWLGIMCVLWCAGCAKNGGLLDELTQSLAVPSPGQTAREAFNIQDADLRRRSVDRLSAAPFGGEASYLRLYRLLIDDPDPTVRAACVKAIGMHGSMDDVKLILAQLDHQDTLVRWEAAKALQKFHDPDAVGPLIKLVHEDQDIDVRMAAAAALGQYTEIRVYHALVGALDDPSFGVAETARQSLQTLTGYDFGHEGSLWLMWAQKRSDRLFDERRPFMWQPYVKPAGLLDKLMFWKEPEGIGPMAPKGMPPSSSTEVNEESAS